MPQNKTEAKIKTHDYVKYASKYAELGIDDSNYLAFRDIPQLIEKHAKGVAALDYGCGAGRSTRFLKNLGLDVIVFSSFVFLEISTKKEIEKIFSEMTRVLGEMELFLS